MVFLTSTGFTNSEVFEILRKNRGEEYNSACIIVTGLLPLKKEHPIAKNSKRYLFNNHINQVDLIDVEFESPSLLEQYDLILILGGHSNHLFYHLRESGADKHIIKHVESGKDIVGASAGAWFLASGNEFSKDFTFLGIDEIYPQEINHQGLNFISMNLFPHYDMFCERVEDLESKLRALEERRGFSLSRLNNMDYIYMDNEYDIKICRK